MRTSSNDCWSTAFRLLDEPVPARRKTPTGGASLLLLVLWTLAIAGCWGTNSPGPANSTTPPAARDSRPTPVATITPAGGTFEKDGAKIVFPVGAVRSDVPLRITALNSAEPSPDQNVFVTSKAYRLDADGARFATAVDVTLPYDPQRLPSGFDEGNLRPMWWAGEVYQPITDYKVDRKRHEVTYRARHFSDHVIGGEKAKAVPPQGWQPKHPELPVQIVVVETYLFKVSAEYLDALEEALAYAYQTITAGKPFRFLQPGAGGDGKLIVTVTDIRSKTGETLGRAVDPTHLYVKYDVQSTRLREVVVHEFFHCVQFTYFEQALRPQGFTFLEGHGDRFIWLNEASAAWITHELVPSGPHPDAYARGDFCFEELCYHSGIGERLEGSIRPGSELHHYAGAIFVKFLVEEYGQNILPALYEKAYSPTFSGGVEMLLDEVVRQQAPKAGKVADNLYSAYARFVLEHVYEKQAFGRWDAGLWKLGSRHELSQPPPGNRRPSEIKLSLGKEVQEVLDGRICQVSKVVTFAVEKPSQDGQVELSLASSGKTRHEPPRWLYAFTEIEGSKITFLKRGGADHVTIETDAQVGLRIYVLPVSLERQTLILKAKLVPRKQADFAGNWSGKSTMKRLGQFDYIASISRRGEGWSIRAGDLSALVYASDVEGCKVTTAGNRMTAELIDKTTNEGQTNIFVWEATLSGDRLNGKETLTTDGKVYWEKEFTLFRKP